VQKDNTTTTTTSPAEAPDSAGLTPPAGTPGASAPGGQSATAGRSAAAGAAAAPPSPASASGGDRQASSARTRAAVMQWVERLATLVGFAAMIAVFWILKPETFGTMANLRAILDQSAVIVLLSVGLTVVLAVGEFDLSFPYLIGLASAGTTLMMTDHHLGAGAAIVIGIALSIVAGCLAGVGVALQRASSFIITLAIGFVWMGIADGLTNSETIVSGLSKGFIAVTEHTVASFSLATVVAAVFAIVVAILLRATVLGRYVQAVGSNAEAGRLAGLPLARIRTIAFGVLGLAVGISAVIITSRQAQYTPNVGTQLFLQPYVACFFGMSVLAARRFNVFGSVVGALFIGTLQTGLVIMGAASWVGSLVQGAVLLAILVAGRRTTTR
jgi:ribose transport system permease protein